MVRISPLQTKRPLLPTGCGCFLTVFLFVSVLTLGAQQSSEFVDRPLQPIYEDGAEYRWLNKPVLASRTLDSMEDLAHWTFAGAGDLTLSETQIKDGRHSLRIRSSDNMGHVTGDGDWQDLLATRHFPTEDWTSFNRISLWVYADVNGAPAISCSLILHTEGAHPLPDNTNEGRNESIPLKNHQWNHVVWEIAPLDRDKVTALDFGYSMPKMLPDPGDQTIFYIDQLELQSVIPDHVEGWDVSPGKIALSHAGYTIGSTNSAIASDLHSKDFSLIDTATGKVVLTAPVELKQTQLGSYQLLDFSSISKTGSYLLRSGSTATRPFHIGDDTWRDSILKAVNFMYAERCGTVIPGIHGVCHQDDYSEHDGKRLLVNGGYHDAGDTTATGNTPGMSYALFSLADRLHTQGEDPALQDRLITEAQWGLNWALKTRFGDGFRTTGQLISYWTNGIMGDSDDRFGPAVNDPEWNFRVAALEALAARVMKDSDPQLAIRSLATAKQDWQFAVDGLKSAAPLPEVYGQKDNLERISFGVLASVDLYRATGEQPYADYAVELARQILSSQERTLQPWTIPMTGYFYTGPSRTALFHRFHLGQEEEPIVALAHLCESLPDNPDWMKWYSAIVLHSQYYQEAAASIDAPFNMLPASIYRVSEADQLPESKSWTPLRTADRDTFLEEVRKGIPLDRPNPSNTSPSDTYLRRFPVWFDFRGNSSVQLSSSKALSTAAQLRGDLDAEDLAQQQAEWLVGRNPFSASIMYGEGYDWTPLYSVRSGQIVGALPVGIETKGIADAPYWPDQSCWTYKEVWSQPVGEWIWLMQDLSGPAVVQGPIAATTTQVELVNTKTKIAVAATIDVTTHTFRAVIPQGRYTVRAGTTHTTLTALAAGQYTVDLRPASAVDFSVHSSTSSANEVTIDLTAQGAGAHIFTLRTDNLKLADAATATITLGNQSDHKLIWHARIIDPQTPWVAVVVKDNSLDQHRELTGVAVR